MSTRREVLLGAAGALAAGVLPFDGETETSPVSYDGDSVRPLDVTGYGVDDGPDVLGVKHLTGFDVLEISTGGDEITLRVDASTTADVSVRAEAAVTREELETLRDEIDAAIREEK